MNTSLMEFLEELLRYNFHFTVTSALRSEAQNKACGGVPNSQHMFGEAIDIKPYGSTTYDQLFSYIRDNVLYDQFIVYDQFIHISFRSQNRYQFIDKRKNKNKNNKDK